MVGLHMAICVQFFVFFRCIARSMNALEFPTAASYNGGGATG